MDSKENCQRLKKRESRKRHRSKWSPYSKKHIRRQTAIMLSINKNKKKCIIQKK